MRVLIPGGFEQVRAAGIVMLVRSDAREWLVPLLLAATRDPEALDARPIAGGRGGAVHIRVKAEELVLRACRRGGLPAWVLRDTYFGCRPRPFREVGALASLRQRGVPVVEAMGACVRWLVPGCYKGWIATRYVAGARSLWDWATRTEGPWDRRVVWHTVGRAIRRLHDAGARHPDLNLHNLLLAAGADAPTVWLVDFDRPWLSGGSGPGADLPRLERSARKLDARGQWVTPADLADLRAGYAGAAP
ncbi:MAG: lipopolysaccharide kinase InaA family protein [Candidatus Binatia bacterium]